MPPEARGVRVGPSAVRRIYALRSVWVGKLWVFIAGTLWAFTKNSLWALTANTLWALPAHTAEAPIQDPTRPVDYAAPGAQAQQVRSLRLQAIILGQGRAEAVINGRRLRPGDTVDQARIIAIHPGRVTYERGGARAELILRPVVTRPAGDGE